MRNLLKYILSNAKFCCIDDRIGRDSMLMSAVYYLNSPLYIIPDLSKFAIFLKLLRWNKELINCSWWVTLWAHCRTRVVVSVKISMQSRSNEASWAWRSHVCSRAKHPDTHRLLEWKVKEDEFQNLKSWIYLWKVARFISTFVQN